MGGQQYEEGKAVVLPVINFSYIQKVLAHIESNPLRLEMRTYWQFSSPLEKYKAEGWPDCGTKACFAGWGLFLSLQEDWPKDNDAMSKFLASRRASTYELARDLFGFTDAEADDVFEGNSSFVNGPEKQLKYLKEALNRVFAERGMMERV